MVRLELKLNKNTEEIKNELKQYFGKDGLGLDVVEENSCCITFGDRTGYVAATLTSKEKKTILDLQSQEWDYHIREFARKMKK